MKKIFVLLILLMALSLLSVTVFAQEADPCLSCHKTETPGIIKQWQDSKHSKVDVECYVCHQARDEDPSGYDHEGFKITAVPSPRYCEDCHPEEKANIDNN